MGQEENLINIYGTSEPVETLRHFSIGPLSFYYSSEALRRISWNGQELVRALSWPMRDENWGTYPIEIIEERVDHNGVLDAKLHFSVGGDALFCELGIVASPDGKLSADITMSPSKGSFSTNRAGFTVLHPIEGLAGARLTVQRSGGGSENTAFPKHIQPDQPVKDISGLNYGIAGQSVEIVFLGEVFEMEDQRNWSDASYKTYCVPLAHPFTYEISEPIRQSVQITFSGEVPSTDRNAEASEFRDEISDQLTPEIGLAVETGWSARSTVPLPSVSYTVWRISPESAPIAELVRSMRDCPELDLEVVLPDDAPFEDALQEISRRLRSHGVLPNRVMALREAYLASHQPVGPWPDGPSPNDLLPLVKAAFPDAEIGGGMMTNFTELNRFRPDLNQCSYLTHGLTPLVHAGDDMSVLETLEALPHIFASMRAIANDMPYRLGLVSIGMRSNPYGAAVAENPNQVRRTMARIDPRHRGIFGAAYAVGVLAATEGCAVDALCLGAPTGPFGLIYEQGDYPQEGYDGEARQVYPLYHVVSAAAAMAGKPRLHLSGLADGLVGFGAVLDGRSRVLLANVSAQSQQVPLGPAAQVRTLDVDSFDAATSSFKWLDSANASRGTHLELTPFAVAFIDLPEG